MGPGEKRHFDAVIVGSHFSKLVEEAPDAAEAVREVVRSARALKDATRRRTSP